MIVTLTNPSRVIIGTNPEVTYTILDDDPMPVVSVSSAVSQTVGEATPTASFTVSLSAPSGRVVTVPFSAGAASTASDPADYAYTTTNPLTFAPGDAGPQTISMAIVDDTIDEPDETVATVLGTPINATLSASKTFTLTITDDDLACYGAGTWMVCFPSAPTTPLTLPGSINTDGGQCLATQPVGWTAQAQPPACFMVGSTITAAGTTTVQGSRPLVLVAADTITVSSLLDVASHRGGNKGPAAPAGQCMAFPTIPPDNFGGSGGGAGASFLTAGGNGGAGEKAGNTGGTAPPIDAAPPSVLRAGCTGQAGGATAGSRGAGGLGGGAIYLVAGASITFAGTGVLDASGAGGDAGGTRNGGGGGGSGGTIVLYAPAINAIGARLLANGGGGASGGDSGQPGTNGIDPNPASPLTPAPGAAGSGGAGGAGYAGGIQAAIGTDGPMTNQQNAGGGGGGGGGYIQSNVPLTGATVSAGQIQAP